MKRKRRIPHFFLKVLIVLAFLWFVSFEALAQENDECFGCHTKEILELNAKDRAEMVEQSTPSEGEIKPYPKNVKTFADLSLFVNQERYAKSVHGELECISCHEDISEIPHQQHLQKPKTCCNCHDEEIAEAVANSAHGKLSQERYSAGCVGCHDPHYGKPKDAWKSDFDVKGCLPCHKVCTPEMISHKDKIFSQAELHLTDCVICHVSGENKNPHKIELAEFALKDCSACHSGKSILLTKKSESKKYIIGATRIPLLDTLGLIIFFGTFGLPIVHGGLRFIFRKKKVK